MNSVLHILHHQILSKRKEPCLHHLVDGEYQSITFETVALRSQQVSDWLNKWANSGDHVVIWANNCWQWAITDLGCQLSGMVSVPIYATTGDDDLAFIFKDASPTIVFVDDISPESLALLQSFSSVKKVVSFHSLSDLSDDLCVHFDDIVSDGPDMSDIREDLWTKNRLSDVVTMLYTSGTTGTPKSVPLTHNNIVQNFVGIRDIIPINSADVSLSFLPLAHIFERTVGFFCVLGVGAQIYYAQSIDTVANDLLIAKPTFIISVPRLYEKIYQKLCQMHLVLKK